MNDPFPFLYCEILLKHSYNFPQNGPINKTLKILLLSQMV